MATIDQRVKELERTATEPQLKVFLYGGELDSPENKQRLNDFEADRSGMPDFYIQIVGVGDD
jgi:hypothetical protein